MTFETLEIIHRLLKEQHLKLEEQVTAAKAELNQAYRALEDTENVPECDPAAVEEATLAVETCKAAKCAAVKEMCATKRALDDFEAHEWH